MRITGGQVRGRLLATPKISNIRPTSDRVREAIFNILGQDMSGLTVLDLFSGTGSLGLEALSRGALQAYFIDKSQESLDLVKKNLSLCGYPAQGKFFRKDLSKGVPGLLTLLDKAFDLVFMDPPYRKNLIPFLLNDLSDKELLESNAYVVIESSKSERLPSSPGNLQIIDIRRYGDTKISFYISKENK